jgi:hypothetical protein
MTQLQIHKKIDEFLKAGVAVASVAIATELIAHNADAKRYFFSIADESWLRWLRDNNFFDELKKPTADKTKYSYRLPELEYLTRVCEKDPETAAEIIEATPISSATFNPEVVGRFFWIIGLLPVEQIRDLLPKILRENWAQLMSPFNESGYQYKKIVEKIKDAKDYDALLELARIILFTRTREEFNSGKKFSFSDRFFYLYDITETGIFEAVMDIEATKTELALKTFLEILSKVVGLGKDDEETTFAKADPFYLLNVDIFTLELDSDKRSHSREDIQNLVAICKKLTEKLFASICSNEAEARRLYDTYISTLQDSRTLWRLKLYAITRCPDLFKEELKDALFRVFTVDERYFDIDGGAEYHRALIAGFGSLDENTTQREYVAEVFKYYGATLGDKDKESWRKRDGLEIMACIKDKLKDPEIAMSESLFGKFPADGKFVPHTGMSEMRSGVISPRTPFKLADFTVEQIIEHLKTDWTPKVLSEKFKNEGLGDFLNPIGSEGLGEGLRNDLKVRTADYFTNLDKLFDRESIDASYMYSLLRGVEELLRNNSRFTREQHLLLLNFFDLIRASGEARAFEKSDDKKTWIGDWITVHKMIADILLSTLEGMKESGIFAEKRDNILALIKYLLSVKSSPDAEHEKTEYGEPSHIAINSVRGQAYRAFVQFTYNEGNVLAADVKKVYEWVLDNDPSSAVRFTVGQFLGSFYFRDKVFIRSLLPKIFPKNQTGKERAYFATWEGYLASVLYQELFIELAEYYAYAITLKKEQYPDRKYLKGLDETLAAHIALAYAQFDLKIGDPLFESFWSTPNETRHYEFTSFTGRHYLTRGDAGEEWMAEHKVDKEKIIAFWDWILKTRIPLEIKTFSGFGFWINPNKEVIADSIVVKNIAASLKKSKGVIDWDYGLLRRLEKFADINPKKTLEIISHLLLLNGDLSPHHRMYFDASRETKEPLKIIYKVPEFKKPVEDLINALIEKGSNVFWDLKDILN